MTEANTQQAMQSAFRFYQSGRLQEAEAVLREALTREPRNPSVLHLLGVVAIGARRFGAAAELIGRAIAANPSNAEYHYNFGHACRAAGRLDLAAAAFQKAIELRPNLAEAHLNLGTVYLNQERLEDAIGCFEQSLRYRPNHIGAYLNLGHAARLQKRLDEAIVFFQKAIGLNPQFAAAYNAMGSSLRAAGRIGESIAAFRKAVALKPDFREAHSNLVYALYYHPGHEAKEIFAEHRRWDQQHAAGLFPTSLRYSNDPTPDRRLRIAYVSPDLRDHVTGWYIEPILEAHDHSQFEVMCYCDETRPDAVMQRLQRHADLWRTTAGLSDEQLADTIRQDRVDILVDLTLHMAHNRLLVFARKPAPLQVTYLAYPATSGMRAMDYRITDVHLDPPGWTEQYHTEQLIRLPDTFWCYREPENSPDVNPLPASSAGHVTFGSLNSFAKITPAILKLWSRVLNAVPSSRLALLIPGGSRGNTAARNMLEQNGIPSGRVDLFDQRPRTEYLRLYHQVDISLDPLPYQGHTTSLDSLWMGVPVISMAGQTGVSRAGVTLLTNIGMTDLLARDPEQYVDIAVDLARDLPRLIAIRGSLRQRMRQSPLMDGLRFTRHLEGAYRQMWVRWCAGGKRVDQ